jgi:hypothetical protein
MKEVMVSPAGQTSVRENGFLTLGASGGLADLKLVGMS